MCNVQRGKETTEGNMSWVSKKTGGNMFGREFFHILSLRTQQFFRQVVARHTCRLCDFVDCHQFSVTNSIMVKASVKMLVMQVKEKVELNFR